MNTAKFTNQPLYGVKHSTEISSQTFCVFLSRALAIAIACFSSASFATQGVDYIATAKYQTTDKYNVNVAGNQLTPSIDTVAIGGELGLKHSISLMGNYFDLSHSNNGYKDKFAGGLRYTGLGTNKSPGGYPDVPSGGEATVMRASFLGQQADFMVIKNDGTYLWSYYGGSDYHYEAVADKRHTLNRRSDGLVWTQPDGTEVFLSTQNETNTASATTNFAAQKIVFPNGFTIVVGSLVGVTTNTGFALRYDFESTDPGLDPSKYQKSQSIASTSNVPAISSGFRNANPKYVTAINTAIEACDVSTSTPCVLNKAWPKATFTWPGGMPRTMFIDRSTFSVTNAAGAKTDYIYEAQDAGLSNGVNANPQYYTTGNLIAPRLVEIKSPGATTSSAFYTYTNGNPYLITHESGPAQSTTPKYDDRLLSGKLTSATGILGTQSYDASDLIEYHGKSYRSGGDIVVSQYTTSPAGILEKIDDLKGNRVVNFELTYRNFVTSETFGWAPTKVYHYDDRGNVDSVTQGVDSVTQLPIIAKASYPSTCSNPKTCNKPDWVEDPNGKRTYYTYHADSGQIQTITSPADKNNISSVVRYGYELKYANYFQTNGGTKLTSPTGIWLKTTEKTCINTATVGDACAGNGVISAANDEVVTTYEYNHDNLLLTGMTVKAVNSNNVMETRRTCYRYDIYGNRIGVTPPNAQPTSCPQ